MGAPGALVVGTGFGCRVHVPALRNAGFEVLGPVGRDPDRTGRRAERMGIPNVFTSFDEALGLEGVRAVTIATPPATHAELAIAAARAGKHVLCEKPFAMTAAEAYRMLRAAEEAGVMHLVGHEFRWAPDRAIVGRVIADGLIGEARLCTLVSYTGMVADPAAPVPRWWFDPEQGGGWLGAAGSHIVDQLRVWLGEIRSVSATTNVTSARDVEAEDSFTIRFTTRDGCEGVLQQTAGAWGDPTGINRVAGTAGTVWTDAGGVHVADASGSRIVALPSDLELPPPPPPTDDTRERFTHLELGPYTRLAEVLRAGVDGRTIETAVPVPTFRDGLASMLVLDAVRASAASNGELVHVEAIERAVERAVER